MIKFHKKVVTTYCRACPSLTSRGHMLHIQSVSFITQDSSAHLKTATLLINTPASHISSSPLPERVAIIRVRGMSGSSIDFS